MQEKLDRIESKLDRLLSILGDGKGKLPSEIKREALAKVLQLSSRKKVKVENNPRISKKNEGNAS
jgi:hypothetical protein